MGLNEEQRKKIREYIKLFKKYSESEEYQRDLEERKAREKFLSEALRKDRIESMTEFDFGEIISKLWATGIWTNKEYLVQKIINDNGLDKIKERLKDLLYGQEPFEKRFDRFVRNVKGLGPASITEILCFFNPKEYGIWNDKARKALKILGFENVLPLKKYQISGRDYIKFNQVAKNIAEELREAGFKDADLLMLDYFLYEVWRAGELKQVEKEPKKYVFDHDEIRDFIRDIGLSLGFEAETEKTIGHGARVDVIWRAKIANLGVVTYVFEVHKSGSIDSLVLNLQKAIRNPTVQKVIAVSDKEQLEKIKKEVQGLPDDFIRALSFWDAYEVEQIHEKLSEVIKSIEKLELVKSEFNY
jgi:hypothetical protein